MLEDGAYRRMLDVCYATEKPLPADSAKICRLVRARSFAERTAVDVVLSEFFVLTDEGWVNKRAVQEIGKALEKSAKARASAEVSAAVRRGERPSARKVLSAEWAALVEVCGSKCVKCASVGPLERDHIIPTYQGGKDELENWQPLCRACNASKGPDRTDHRPLNWRSAFAKRSLSGGLAPNNQEPITNNQRTSTTTALGDSRLPPKKNGHARRISFNGQRFEGITEEDELRWQEAYPAIAIPPEIERAAVWAAANPANKKSNWERFLVNWFSRAQERAPRVRAA